VRFSPGFLHSSEAWGFALLAAAFVSREAGVRSRT